MKTKLLLFLSFILFASQWSFAQNRSYQLSSHILDINSGSPAPGVKISLYKLDTKDNTWTQVDEKVTDENGRIKDFLPDNADNKGGYKLTYHVGPYFEAKGQDSFYPFIDVVFQIKDDNHYHVPITLSPYGYSTYRGN